MKEHYWEHCDLCGHSVLICGKCGNNTCNGGSGTVDGKDCDMCDSAYELYLRGVSIEHNNNNKNRN